MQILVAQKETLEKSCVIITLLCNIWFTRLFSCVLRVHTCIAAIAAYARKRTHIIKYERNLES
jgi:hypothetical protein